MMRRFYRELESDLAFRGLPVQSEPEFIDRRCEREFENARDALNALFELEGRAMEIMHIRSWLEGYGGPRFAIAFPESFKSIAPVAVVLYGYRNRTDPGFYEFVGDAVGRSEFHQMASGDENTLFLGNEATITIGPLHDV